MLNFGIDIDGTVTSYDYFYKNVSEHFKINIEPETIKTYNILESTNLPPEDLIKWFKENEDKLCSIATVRDHAQKILSKWYENYKLYFISARSSNVLSTTHSWFSNQNIPYTHIELLNSHDKVETAKKFKIDLFFEDKHDNAVAISQECNIPVILFDTPYNRDEIPENVIRVSNWLEVEIWVDNWINNLN